MKRDFYIDTEWKERYDELISKAQGEKRGLKKLKDHGKYFNIHHIVPRSLDGSDDDSNLVKLTHREHFLAHKYLFKMYENTNNTAAIIKMGYAWNFMSNRQSYTEDEYKEVLSANYISNKLNTAGEANGMFGKGHLLVGEKNGMFGRKHTKEARKKCGTANIGNRYWVGKNHSEESKKKIQDKLGWKILFRGVIYPSIKAAHRETGVSRYFVKKEIKRV